MEVKTEKRPHKGTEGNGRKAPHVSSRAISAPLKLEKELRRASQYARSLIEASLDPLVTISPEGKITDVNEATIKVTGVSREGLIGADFSNYFTEPEKARQGYRQVFDKGFVTDYPLTIRHVSGKMVDVLYNASVYKDAEGRVLGVFAAARDVTESRRLMRELAEAKGFLDNILQSSTKYSIIGMDLDRKILSWNEGAHLNYGYMENEVMGKDSIILHSSEDIKSGAVDKMISIAHERGLAEGEFQRVRKDGSRFTASVVVTRRNDAAGHPIGYLLMSNDITEKKQAEENLRALSRQIQENLAASVGEILSMTMQLASVTNETATSVSETTSAVDEVKRTAQLASEKARNVSEGSQMSVVVAGQGRAAVTKTIDGINHIRGLMETVAESIVKLSEQTQAIGEIITTVNDLAQQSNLLSVNAAIEASKAGEQGKGFTVVAQEIRNLADQSKQATEQVRTILTDIQKATGASVMAAEQVSKAVDVGVMQADESGEAINKLAESITEAAQAAAQIAASSRQQVVGMDQISLAMESISQAAEQNMTVTKQTEQAAHKLNELGQKLKDMVGKYGA